MATQFESLPAMFTDMATNLDKADDSLGTIESSLVTMSDSVKFISTSLGEYETMVNQSTSSMDNLKSVLTDLQTNLSTIMNGATIAITLILVMDAYSPDCDPSARDGSCSRALLAAWNPPRRRLSQKELEKKETEEK